MGLAPPVSEVDFFGEVLARWPVVSEESYWYVTRAAHLSTFFRTRNDSIVANRNSDTLPKSDKIGWLVAAVLPVVLLTPFLTKAYHVDSPFFLWGAEQILSAPFEFYGFEVNWITGTSEPAFASQENPPLVSSYIALIALLFGWGETAMHTAFLLPAIGASTGMFYLARMTSNAPFLATASAVVSPLFALSASNIMAEMPMLCFYVWSVALWVRGMRDGSLNFLVAAGGARRTCRTRKVRGDQRDSAARCIFGVQEPALGKIRTGASRSHRGVRGI